MGYLSEYIGKGLSAADLEKELLNLIKKYNKLTGNFLFVYSAAISKQIPQLAMQTEDYYIIFDILKNTKATNLDFYIETPGGSGEAAEEIVKFLRSKFNSVAFVVTGEAKSAGTIIVLSGNNIKMTLSGSLGPIDAQVQIGRSVFSAYDYMSWIKLRRAEAGKKGKLNPFDATMIAQISPGELVGVNNALNFAHDLVREWLPKYKFKDWILTESLKKKVTLQMKERRAKEIAERLSNHNKWRSHGRSLKIADLEEIGLKIDKIDEDLDLAELVYRIQIVIKLIFNNSSVYKVYATESEKIVAQATKVGTAPTVQPQNAGLVEFTTNCPRCGKVYKLFALFVNNTQIENQFKQNGYIRIPKNNKLVCSCGYEIDTKGFRNDIETQARKKIVD